ncbi:MAG: integrase [Methanobrevibacter sp.]|jgi:hypothetical protein|nr:integrase [Candidatus Methanoflexus mossambicus]
MKNSEDIFKEFCDERNLRKNSIKSYKSALNSYCEYHKTDLKELLKEAFEEEKEIPLNVRKIKGQLKNYQKYLIYDKKLAITTIKDWFGKIKTFYKHNEVELPYIPTIKMDRKIEKYEDIPKLKDIKIALKTTKNPLEKAIILFMATSGTAKKETLNLTINDFINATKEYHNSNKIIEVIKTLENKNEIIPTFEIIRTKTNRLYYTSCSDEATKLILKYLKTRKELKNEDKLFKISDDGLMKFFRRINNENNWGKVNHYCFFHSHGLRKFNATTIEDKAFANLIQGRKLDPTTESYFKQNPKRTKEKYLQHLHKFKINPSKNDKKYLTTEEKIDRIEKDLNETKRNLNEIKKELKTQNRKFDKLLAILNEINK